MAPRVSVVIPAYNSATHIQSTVRSVLDQTFRDFELLISDHSSTDGTWELLQQFTEDSRVSLERIAPGGGAERNWNHVTALAKGEFLKLVCGDDLIDPLCLEAQVGAFEEGGDGVVMVACRRDIIDARGGTIVRGRGLRRLDGRVGGAVAARRSIRAGTNVFGEPCAVMIRRRVLVEAGLWDASHGYVIDLATYFKVLRRGDLVVQTPSLASFRLSAGQWSVELRDEQERQVHEFRRRALQNWPRLASRRDRVQGALMTKAHAVQRRLAYRILARRL